MDNFQNYPTPKSLAIKAWNKFQTHEVIRMLEPAAGEGKLIDSIKEQRGRTFEVDCCELNMERHVTLRAKGYNVVGLDFMEYEDCSMYSHIIMNPPFRLGCHFVLRAWDLIWSGEIVAILNAETIRNPYSKERAHLKNIIDKHGTVEFIQQAFTTDDTERKTEVEIALVHLVKKAGIDASFVDDLVKGLEKDSEPTFTEAITKNELAIPGNFIKDAVRTFQTAVTCLKKMAEITCVFNYHASLLGKSISEAQGQEPLKENSAVEAYAIEFKRLKGKAWAGIIRSIEFQNRLSRSTEKHVNAEFENIKQLAFTESNIYGLLNGLINKKGDIQRQMCNDVFDSITKYHSENIVFYMGWKSNDHHRFCAYRIKKRRFILPNFSYYSRGLDYDSTRRLQEIDSVFAMLDGKSKPAFGLEAAFNSNFGDLSCGERIETDYFDVRFYPGIKTIHFFPRNQELMDKLNRIVGQSRNWLPNESVDERNPFWQQFNDAEKFEKQLDQEVRALGYPSYQNPRDILTRTTSDESQRDLDRQVGNILSVIIEKHGIQLSFGLTKQMTLPALAA